MKNDIIKYANQLFKSDYSKTNPDLLNDFTSILDGNCIYLPNFFCSSTNYDIIVDLAKDLEENMGSGMVGWSKHFKYENPDFSPTFRKIVTKMAEYFDIEIYHTRLNFYKDGRDWKPFHHDSHSYGNKSLREDFTMGASFGACRELAILHDKTEQQFRFPQNNGDIFAFTSKVNQLFQHGVPKSNKIDIGPRFSIIVWGRRKTLNGNNGGKNDIILDNLSTEMNIEVVKETKINEKCLDEKKEIEISGKELMEMVTKMVETKKNLKDKLNRKKKNGRIQSGWNNNRTI